MYMPFLSFEIVFFFFFFFGHEYIDIGKFGVRVVKYFTTVLSVFSSMYSKLIGLIRRNEQMIDWISIKLIPIGYMKNCIVTSPRWRVCPYCRSSSHCRCPLTCPIRWNLDSNPLLLRCSYWYAWYYPPKHRVQDSRQFLKLDNPIQLIERKKKKNKPSQYTASLLHSHSHHSADHQCQW